MNAAERKALGRYIRAAADTLGLRDWTFTILTTPCDDENAAVCTPTYGRKLATIAFEADFRRAEATDQRHTVVHELLHCVFAPEQDHARVNLLKHLGQSTYDVYMDAYRLMHEYAIDGLADAIAPQMPLICWPKPRKTLKGRE